MKRRRRIPVHKIPIKGKTFLIILNLFYTYSRGESSAEKRRKNNSITKKVSENELKVIKENKKEFNDVYKIIKGRSSKKKCSRKESELNKKRN